jgi:hypothetical protein
MSQTMPKTGSLYILLLDCTNPDILCNITVQWRESLEACFHEWDNTTSDIWSPPTSENIFFYIFRCNKHMAKDSNK